jgi:hypothetical protein
MEGEESMLKRKLADGTIGSLSLESVQGGALLVLGNEKKEGDRSSTISFMMNPECAIAFHQGIGRGFFFREDDNGAVVKVVVAGLIPSVSIAKGDLMFEFPISVQELYFMQKALERMSGSFLFSGTWSGKARPWEG